jgi:transcriptional regulator with XRE-family HTH domain
MQSSTPQVHIGKNIACIRHIKGIKQAVFAKALGITQQAVSKMEQSEDISHSRLLHVATILGVTAEFICSFDEAVIIGNAG